MTDILERARTFRAGRKMWPQCCLMIGDLMDEVDRLRMALVEIQRLVEQLPSGIDVSPIGIDEDTDPNIVAHVGGLIYKAASAARGET